MQKLAQCSKFAEAKSSVILAVYGMSGLTGRLVTHNFDTDVLAMEVFALQTKLAVSILVKLADIHVHVH